MASSDEANAWLGWQLLGPKGGVGGVQSLAKENKIKRNTRYECAVWP